jgi:hypothetical protein
VREPNWRYLEIYNSGARREFSMTRNGARRRRKRFELTLIKHKEYYFVAIVPNYAKGLLSSSIRSLQWKQKKMGHDGDELGN